MAQKFANAARAVLAAGIVSGDTTVTIVSGGSLFPEIASPDFARAVLQDESGIEIVLITAHTASADSFTVTRAQESTTARSFDAGSIFGIRVTAADMDEALDAVNLASEVTGTLPVANGGTGATSLTANNVILGNGTSAVQEIAPGTTGNVLTSNGTTWASSPLPASEVTLNGEETLTNKTLTSPVINTPTGIVKGDVGLGDVDNTSDATKDAATATLTNKTLTAPVLTSPVINDGYTEEVFAVSGTTPALSPTNGSIQTWTLSGASTPTAGTWAAGQSITLMVDDGTDYTITWTSLAVTWKTDGGSAPTLNTSGYTAIALWKVGSTIYGARVGDA